MDNNLGYGLSRTITSVCVNEDDQGQQHDMDTQSDLRYRSTTNEDVDDMGTFCCETDDFDDFQTTTKSPSTTNVINMEGCILSNDENFVESSLSTVNAFIDGITCVDTAANETVQGLFNSSSDDNETIVENEQRNIEYDETKMSFDGGKRENERSTSKLNKLADKSDEMVTLDQVQEEHVDMLHQDEKKHENLRDDEDDNVDVTAGLRDLLQKLFMAIKQFIPIKSANIQQLLERSLFGETIRRQTSNMAEQDDAEIDEESVTLNAYELFEFENIIQKLFNDFQEEWILYQTVQERRLDEVFVRGVQAARQQAEAEAAEAREEAVRKEAPNIPAIVTKCSALIKELRRERSVLAKYIIEKRQEWGLLRESLAREITTLRKDNTRLLSNKLATVNGNGHGKGSKIAPFNQRTLESMVHSKYCLEKALMLDVTKQSKINELKLIVLQQQEHIRELQATVFDLSSRTMIEEINKESIEQTSTGNSGIKAAMSDSALLDYIIKDMTSRIVSRDDVDNVMQVLYCDEDYYLPNTATSADLATLRVYCLGGTWRSDFNSPKLNATRPRYENCTTKLTTSSIGTDHCKSVTGEVGEIGGEKATIIVSSPEENTAR